MMKPNNEETNPIKANRLNIAGDVVYVATADLPDEERGAIRWLHSHAVELNLSRAETGELIDYDTNTIYQVFTGRHKAGKANITKAILKYKELADARRGADKLSFIETRLTKKIWEVCRASLTYQRIGFIFGDSQIGKTTALEEYAIQHNHGETKMVTMPAGGAMTDFLAEMASILKIHKNQKVVDLKRAIVRSFDSRMLLIVDEAHQCFVTSRNGYQNARHIRVLEFIREIHDRSKCGVVISATNVFREELETGRTAGVLNQLHRRRLTALQLPNVPTKADLNTFAKAYSLPPAEDEAMELQIEVINDQALGVWLTLLRMTATRCHRNKSDMTWEEVIRSYDMLRKLEN